MESVRLERLGLYHNDYLVWLATPLELLLWFLCYLSSPSLSHKQTNTHTLTPPVTLSLLTQVPARHSDELLCRL